MTRPTDKNRRNLYIYDNDYAYLKKIGGTYAEGLRRAVEAHKHGQSSGSTLNASRGDERGEG